MKLFVLFLEIIRAHWSPEMTSTLIAVYSNVKNTTNLKGERLWWRIACEVKSQKYNVTEKMCETKWEALVRTYKSIVDRKNQTGTSPQKKWRHFDEMDSVLFKRPDIQPPAVASSLRGYTSKISPEIQENKINPKPKKRITTKESPMTLKEVNDEANFRFESNLKRRDRLLDILQNFFEASKKFKDSKED